MTTASTSKGPPPQNLEVESKRGLVRRVVESSTFAKSERLSSFLICICDLTLSGRANEINEQKIGTTVFGRSPDYDAAVDGIVRPQASRLRQRLDLYFRSEGASEPIRITLPRGSYVPVFEPNAPQPAVVETPAVQVAVSTDPIVLHTAPAPVSARPQSRLPWILVTGLLFALIAIGIRNLRRAPTSLGSAVNANPMWDLLFRPNQRTIVVPSDTGLVMWQSATGQKIDLERYLSGSYRAQTVGDIPTGQVNPPDLASRRYTSIVDLEIVKQLSQIADMEKNKLSVAYARDVNINDLKEANIVLIGAKAANPWVELFEPKMDFVFADARIRQYTVMNLKPKGAEPTSWTANYDDPQHRIYGVVAFLPNLRSAGNVLLVEGTSMAGTQSAWDFVADDSLFIPFIHRIRRSDGSIPHFQLVLESINFGGSSVKRDILAYRVMD